MMASKGKGWGGALLALAAALLVTWALPVSAGSETEDDALDIVQEKLTTLNAMIDEMLERLVAYDYTTDEEWAEDQERLRDELTSLIGMLPDVFGLPFSIWFEQLKLLDQALTSASSRAAGDWSNTDLQYHDIEQARRNLRDKA